MASIVERIGALAGTELSKAVDLAHHTYQNRVQSHRHVGRALVETVAEVCRNHPNLVGIGAGLLVEQLLVHEKERHDAHLAAGDLPPLAASTPAEPLGPGSETLPATTLDGEPETGAGTIRNAHLPHTMIRLSELKPRRVALEVFGGLLLLKLATTGAKMFRHKHQGEIWFAPAARIRLFSGTIAAWNLVAAMKSPKVSAWRNGAVFFFGTDALKPILKVRKTRRG